MQLVEFVVLPQHLEGFIIWWLKFLAHCITVHKNVSGGVACASLLTNWMHKMLRPQHDGKENQKKCSREPQCCPIHEFCTGIYTECLLPCQYQAALALGIQSSLSAANVPSARPLPSGVNMPQDYLSSGERLWCRYDVFLIAASEGARHST